MDKLYNDDYSVMFAFEYVHNDRSNVQCYER